MKKILQTKNIYYLITIFILLLFAYISINTPLQGDDWGYALNGRASNPLLLAYNFYFSWSGRLMSELYGFIVAPHKWLWNILNPLLFASIYILSFKLAKLRKHPSLAAFILLAGILSVDDNLRMETYSWLMGTTYVIPLFFSLVYFIYVDFLFNKDMLSERVKLVGYAISPLLFLSSLMMENISASLMVGTFIIIIYAYFYKRRIIPHLILPALVFTLAFLILRLSPGASARLLRDNLAFAQLPIYQKIITNYANFIQVTFLNNNYAIMLFSCSTIALLLFSKKKVKLVWRFILINMQVLAIIVVFAFVWCSSFINDSNSLFSFLFWPLYVVASFWSIFVSIEEEYYRHKAVFLLAFAGLNALVMLLSPIYGSRSSIYTIFYLLIVAIMLIDNIVVSKKLLLLAYVILSLITVDRIQEYLYKYKLVALAQKERLEILAYYRSHPEVKEAWIPRFPIYTVHGSDVEPSDIYHLETFKEYYKLPQEAKKIIFFFKEQ